MSKERADKLLVAKGLVATRSQAQSYINLKNVFANNILVTKTGELFDDETIFEVRVDKQYVGRGALKLKGALEYFKCSIQDQVVMDVGASTGGFTEILLDAGAQKIFAIDVGTDQLAEKIRTDPRVVNLEKTHILELQTLPSKVDGVVMDLSFISVTKIIPHLAQHFTPDWMIILVKPQFEVGPEGVNHNGIVKSEQLREQAKKNIVKIGEATGMKCRGEMPSPIEGKAGNKEYLIYFVR